MTKEETLAYIKAYLGGDTTVGNIIPLRFVLESAIKYLSEPSLPPNLDEAAEKNFETMEVLEHENIFEETHNKIFKAGVEWMAEQGWINDGSMPPETKYEENTMQGHREWTESKPVLAWDSMYGPRVDATKNGKWMSEQRDGYTGQIVHGIIAWRPIPEFNEELLFNTRKEE